ncbi:olfactory receptor 7G2-like [Arvicanthis niloticus]|uniref:olfactory receptor 7G2-like n=1 Tax=Arvicanthis niloticus TaxID=61156 RepID=UPI0014865A3F|nr:olfactory receptor 7G2-like [Arvicanthis niloticus]
MELKNQTAVSEFHLLGLTDNHKLLPLVFSMFLFMYLIIVLGNLIIVMAITAGSQLHTPMYLFLSVLSINDICYSTVTIPKMLVNIHAHDDSIGYIECLSQICFVSIFGDMENFLLAVMAYDRYVAICKPLRYRVIMNPICCVLMVLFSFLFSITDALTHSLMVLRLSFCTDLEIPHFFCELAQIIKLACSDTFLNNFLIFAAVFVFGGGPVCGIVFSYIYIVSSVLRMPSSEGKHRAFSTCASHLSVVSLFYGTGFGVYISSAVTDSLRNTAMASMMYSVVPPLLNPFIYSLRNREMKESLKKLVGRLIYLM